jgi:hypothetical protein
VGNKSDMADERRAVPYARAKALADEYGIAFFETSAKDNINVEEVGAREGWGLGRLEASPRPGRRRAGIGPRAWAAAAAVGARGGSPTGLPPAPPRPARRSRRSRRT